MTERRPLVVVDNTVKELPIGDTLPGSNFMPYRVEAGDVLVIPPGQSIISCGPFELDGSIELNGRMCL